jgi:hypothetical protein
MRTAVIFVLLGACTLENQDVVGPFTGQTHRYVVDGFGLPHSYTEANIYGGDLDGDGKPDDQLGSMLGYLYTNHDLQTHAQDMIASGAIVSSVEIIADNLDDDASVGVAYVGEEGAPMTLSGGRIEDGVFLSNRTARTSVPGRATVLLPTFADADASRLDLSNLELDLVPDGRGGFDAALHGTIDADDALNEAYRGAAQMLAANPTAHRDFISLFDQPPRDYVITHDEFTMNSFNDSLFKPDVEVHGEMLLSIGFHVHLSPCDAGSCASAPQDTCHDRVRDGDETDVDCGGSCGLCAADQACTIDADCDSNACSGTCSAPTCTDGVRDGLESSVDCGANCGIDCL